MPRITTLDCPGCPPIRALTFDALGLVKVVESRSKDGGVPKVVERWGEPDASKCVVSVSVDDCKADPLVAVARKSGLIELICPLNGEVHSEISNSSDAGPHFKDDIIIGLHLFKKQTLDTSSRTHMLLTCTKEGNVNMRPTEISGLTEKSLKTWNVCATGNILCFKVDGSEKYGLFGGKGFEVNMWDLDQCTKLWTAKSPAKNSLGIYTPPWFTCAAFLNKNDHCKFAAGTNNHQVRIYDISAQRRPVMAIDFRECPIKAVTGDSDGHNIYVGNAFGDLASFDIRTGKLLGCFKGKCSGSIRSIARHPQIPVIASCGLDGYLRFWDVRTRRLLSSVFLKQHLTTVVFDSHFCEEEAGGVVPNEEAATSRKELNKSGNREQEANGRNKKKMKGCSLDDDA